VFESFLVVEIQPKGSAPTMAKLREDYKLLKEENRLLKEENRLLKEERDFLREKGLNPVKTGPSTTSKGIQTVPPKTNTEDYFYRSKLV
jgi:hypothetical protein